jgi:predicted nucleic acid-binding protein
MLLDSNIIIYLTRPEHQALRDLVRDQAAWVSDISYVETLGFHGLQPEDRLLLEEFFSVADAIPMESAILDRAVDLRQQRRMSLGDAIIAATALVYDLTLATRNVADFRWINGLRLHNPFDVATESPH